MASLISPCFRNCVPRRPEELTPAWLTACLRHAGAIHEASVTALEITPLGVGRGFAGRLCRVGLSYDRAEPGAPPTLVGKFAAEHDSTLTMMTEMGGYLREVRFYRELADAVPMPTPRCFLARHDPETHHFALLLEDLAPAAAVDLERGLDVEQARELLTHLAAMHARFWGRPEGLAWLAPGDEVVHGLRHRYAAGLPAFEARFEAFPYLVKVARQVAWVLAGEEFIRDLRRPPQTLTHGDLHLENVFFPTAAGGRFAVVDWQTVILSRHGASDVTRVIAMGLAPETRRAHGASLLAHYHQQLVERGVRGYRRGQLRWRYRLEMGSQVLIAVVAHAALDFATGRDGLLVEMFGRRLCSALEDEGIARTMGLLIGLTWPLRPFYNAYLALRRGGTRSARAG